MEVDELIARVIAAHKRRCSPSHPEVDGVWTSYLGQARAVLAADPLRRRIADGIASFRNDPPDSDRQRGYLAALEELAR